MSDEDLYGAVSGQLKLAHRAAFEEDWPLVVQHLNRLQQSPPEPPALAKWQDLALRTLEAGDFHVRWDVAKLMAGASPDLPLIQPPRLIALLDEVDLEDDSLLWFLVRILGEQGSPESIPALLALLRQSPPEDVTAAVVTALGQIGVPAIAPICGLLDDPHLRPAAVQALAQIRHPDAVAPLMQVIRDANPEVRALAIATLADAQHPEAQPVLVEALDDVASIVRRTALRGLGKGLGQAPATVTKIGDLLWDLNLGVRRAAILALGRSRLSQAADILFTALQAPDMPPGLRPQLIVALAQTETAAAMAHLTSYAIAQYEALGKTGVPILAVATSLGRVETPQLAASAVALLKRLITWTSAADSAERCAIASSLGQLPPTGEQLQLLLAMLDGADTSLRLHIVAALRKVAPDEAEGKLQAIAAHPRTAPALRQAAQRALQDWQHTPRHSAAG
ncbi:MAG: HEAT repeat domain-containing protein [Cyanobacteria bacterium P01_A01_bin.135]